VGNVPLGSLIDRLRAAAGQPALEVGADEAAASERPAWIDVCPIVDTYDARATIESGGHPMPQVMSALANLKGNESYLLITPFVPAPLVDLAAQKGFESWTGKEAPEKVLTYFRKKGSAS
jgi:hypothetical protein